MPSYYSIPSWKDKLFTASFRGKKFHVESVDSKVGRRNVVHQFPLREEAYSEDLGLDADEFTVDGFVIQKKGNDFDYFGERDALLDALRDEGPGKLVHPFLGEFNVVVKGKALVTESFREGGMARFRMTFVVVKTKPLLERNVFPDHISQIDDKAESSFAKLRDSFHDMRTKISSTINYYTKSRIVTGIQTGFKMIEGGFGGVKGVISSTVSKLRKDITDAISSVSNAVNSACSLSELILDTIDKPLSLIGVPDPVTKSFLGACSFKERATAVSLPGDGIPRVMGDSMVDAFLTLANYGESITTVQTSLTTGYSATETRNPDASYYGGRLDDISVTNANSAAQAVDRIYTINMLRAGALINSTRVAVRMLTASYEEMKDLLLKITEAMDDLVIKMADESASTTYSDYNISIDNSEIVGALEDVRSNFVQVMRDKGASLAKKMDYTVPPIVLPTMVLAYEQYDDVLRDEEIFDRNRKITIHPGFLPGGEVIDILDE